MRWLRRSICTVISTEPAEERRGLSDTVGAVQGLMSLLWAKLCRLAARRLILYLSEVVGAAHRIKKELL